MMIFLGCLAFYVVMGVYSARRGAYEAQSSCLPEDVAIYTVFGFFAWPITLGWYGLRRLLRSSNFALAPRDKRRAEKRLLREHERRMALKEREQRVRDREQYTDQLERRLKDRPVR